MVEARTCTLDCVGHPRSTLWTEQSKQEATEREEAEQLSEKAENKSRRCPPTSFWFLVLLGPPQGQPLPLPPLAFLISPSSFVRALPTPYPR